jgi:hypothetical protein
VLPSAGSVDQSMVKLAHKLLKLIETPSVEAKVWKIYTNNKYKL